LGARLTTGRGGSGFLGGCSITDVGSAYVEVHGVKRTGVLSVKVAQVAVYLLSPFPLN
jgi:hypothetical protein